MTGLLYDAVEACSPQTAGLLAAIGLTLSTGGSAVGAGLTRLITTPLTPRPNGAGTVTDP